MRTVTEYGAVGDGIADDTVAIQAAITAGSVNRYGGTVTLPAGLFRFTSTLTLRDTNGMRLVGEGFGTKLLWAGDASSPAILLDSVRSGVLSDFHLQPIAPAALAVGIRIVQTKGLTASRQNRFSHLALGGMAIGVQIGGSAGVDLNNDLHHFEDCSVANYTTCGWSLEGSQVYGVRIENCLANGAPGARCAVQSDAYNNGGGSFIWTGGGASGHAAADFILGAPTAQPTVIEHAWFENSARFIQTGGPSGAPRTLSVEGCRWAGSAVAADGEFIRFWYPGPLILRGNRFGDAAPIGTQLKVSLAPTARSVANARFIVEHNSVRYLELTYPNQQPTTATGSQVYS
jgi:hypothetical protein